MGEKERELGSEEEKKHPPSGEEREDKPSKVNFLGKVIALGTDMVYLGRVSSPAEMNNRCNSTGRMRGREPLLKDREDGQMSFQDLFRCLSLRSETMH